MATEGAVAPPIVNGEIKEAALSFMLSDSLQDAPNKMKRRSWFRISSCEKDLSFLNYKNKTEVVMRLKLHGISRIVEPEKRYLCLEYGPDPERPMFILLDFTDEPSESLEEWDELLRNMMGFAQAGLEYFRPRSKTVPANDRTVTVQKPKPSRAISAFQPIIETPPSNKPPTTPEDVSEPPTIIYPRFLEPPPFSSLGSGSQSPGGASIDSDSGSDISPFASLKSTCFSPQPEELDFTKDRLGQHQFKDCAGEIFVTKTIPKSELNVGDIVAVRNADGPIPKNARGLTEHIRSMAEQTIPLTVTRGVEMTVTQGEQEHVVMNIRGPKTRRPDPVDVVLKACSACNTDTNEESRLAIAEINDTRVEAGTQTEQVKQRLREALQSPEGLRLRLIPQSLLRAEADEALLDDVDDQPGIAEDQTGAREARPIDIGGVPRVSSNTDPAHANEETDC